MLHRLKRTRSSCTDQPCRFLLYALLEHEHDNFSIFRCILARRCNRHFISWFHSTCTVVVLRFSCLLAIAACCCTFSALPLFLFIPVPLSSLVLFLLSDQSHLFHIFLTIILERKNRYLTFRSSNLNDRNIDSRIASQKNWYWNYRWFRIAVYNLIFARLFILDKSLIRQWPSLEILENFRLKMNIRQRSFEKKGDERRG